MVLEAQVAHAAYTELEAVCSGLCAGLATVPLIIAKESAMAMAALKIGAVKLRMVVIVRVLFWVRMWRRPVCPADATSVAWAVPNCGNGGNPSFWSEKVAWSRFNDAKMWDFLPTIRIAPAAILALAFFGQRA
jgi:hypothetical protein